MIVVQLHWFSDRRMILRDQCLLEGQVYSAHFLFLSCEWPRFFVDGTLGQVPSLIFGCSQAHHQVMMVSRWMREAHVLQAGKVSEIAEEKKMGAIFCVLAVARVTFDHLSSVSSVIGSLQLRGR